MKYFIDTEFNERPGLLELISIGIVSEKGDTFYAESCSFDKRNCNDFVKENVLDSLKYRIDRGRNTAHNNCGTQTINNKIVCRCFGEDIFIGQCINGFISDTIGMVDIEDPIEFYGYYADYDWVLFCWLFGARVDLPTGFPMYCRDIKQMIDEKGNPNKPTQKNIEHNALDDAIYHQELYEWIKYCDNTQTRNRGKVGEK